MIHSFECLHNLIPVNRTKHLRWYAFRMTNNVNIWALDEQRSFSLFSALSFAEVPHSNTADCSSIFIHSHPRLSNQLNRQCYRAWRKFIPGTIWRHPLNAEIYKKEPAKNKFNFTFKWKNYKKMAKSFRQLIWTSVVEIQIYFTLSLL